MDKNRRTDDGKIHEISNSLGKLEGKIENALLSINASTKRIESNQDAFLKDLTILNTNQVSMDKSISDQKKELAALDKKIDKTNDRIQSLENSKNMTLWILGAIGSLLGYIITMSYDEIIAWFKGMLW